jgi:hypothetical protein
MKAQTTELSAVLENPVRYLIPTFQRDYEWTEKGQWELLFDDLESVADQLVRERSAAVEGGEPATRADLRVPPHFLGALVFERMQFGAGQIPVHAVIDGQQRLTTIQLLLRGLLDVLQHEESLRARQVADLVINPGHRVQGSDEQYKLWPRRRDRDAWERVMADEADGSSHLYAHARKYFANRFRTAIAAQDGDGLADAFVDSLVSLFKLVVINLEENDDAQLIFEVLNGRQTPLSAADLVKNLLFLRAELRDEEALEALYDRYWAPLDDDWWKVEVGVGHAARGRRDILLSAWLTAVSRSEVNVGHLYGEVRTYLDWSGRKTDDVLEELSIYARAYERLYGRSDPPTRRIAVSYQRIDSLGVRTTVPLLLWLQTLPESRLSPESHETAVLAVESWIVRRLVVGANTRGYGQTFVDILQAVQAAIVDPDVDVASAVIEALNGDSERTRWPSNFDLTESLVTRRAYGALNQNRIRMLLGAVDEQLREESPRVEPAVFAYDRLSIEHVMPQSWKTNWPLEETDEAEAQLAGQRRDAALQRFGNLTLITPNFNSALSNRPWTEKKVELVEDSALQLNGYFRHVDFWDESAIDLRAVAIGDVIARVWPGPPVTSAETTDDQDLPSEHAPPSDIVRIPGRLSSSDVEAANDAVPAEQRWGSFALIQTWDDGSLSNATWFSEFEATAEGFRYLNHSSADRTQRWYVIPYDKIAGATDTAGALVDIVKGVPVGTHHWAIVEAKPHIARTAESGQMGPGVIHGSAPDTLRKHGSGLTETLAEPDTEGGRRNA